MKSNCSLVALIATAVLLGTAAEGNIFEGFGRLSLIESDGETMRRPKDDNNAFDNIM
jgi:hypothetical protein